MKDAQKYYVTYALSLRLFGTFTLEVRGRPAPPLSRSARALLGLLATQGGHRSLNRALVHATLWPDSDEAAARYNLRRTLTEVRYALGPEAERLLAPTESPRTLRLNLSSTNSDEVYCDVVSFDAAVATGNEDLGALQAAVDLYQASGGALLEGERGDWIFPEREARRNAYLTACERLARHDREQGALDEATQHIQAILTLEPTRETAVRDLMTALSASGQTAAALAAYQSLRARLQKDADSAPDAETTALYKRLYQRSRQAASGGANTGDGDAVGAASEKTESPRLPPFHNIPRPLTTLIGRERDVLEVTAALGGDKDHLPARLLTLLGAGGVGKTRLSLAVAEAVAPDYEDGVCFVDFAPIGASTRPTSVVADALRLTKPVSLMAEEDELRFLTDALRARHLLLMLDNCEHVAAQSARLAMTLLRACPRLTLMATSREPLRVPGEIAYRVPGLTTDEATRLFFARASEAQPAFRPQAAHGRTAQEIVTRLDGIPLAIEMAAARTRAFPIAEIAGRLNDVFRLLTTPGGDLLPRHQTLRATLDWSYDLLSPSERTLLARLSVFAGGWTLDAAEAVCADDIISPPDVFDLLASLIDKSLVQFLASSGAPSEVPGSSASDADKGRYQMLETIRQYACEKLKQSDAEPMMREAHSKWCVALAEVAAPHLRGVDVVRWNGRLEREHDNLRAALDACTEAASAYSGGEGTVRYQAVLTGLSLAGFLVHFWEMRGYLSEGRLYLERLLLASRILFDSVDDESAIAVRKAVAHAQNATGILAWNQGDYSGARSFYESSLSLWREIGDKRGIAAALGNLGNVAYNQSDYSVARSLEEESLRLYREIGDRRGIANLLGSLGNIATDQGDYSKARTLQGESLHLLRVLGDQRGVANLLCNLGNTARDFGENADAKPLYEESLLLYREMGDKYGIAKALGNLANVALAQGDADAACPLYEESLALYREVGFKGGIASTLTNLGGAVCEQGDYVGARSLLEESVTLFREIGDRRGLTYALDGIATVYRGEGDDQRAIMLWAAADALRESIQTPLSAADEAEWQKQVDLLRSEMDLDVFDAMWDEGRSLSLEQATILSLQ